MSNIIIPAEHQSSPRETPASKAIKQAAQEIHDGKYVYTPELTENAFGKLEDEFFTTGTEVLASHPRVQDAIRVLETQIAERKGNEWNEKAEQLHEINAMLRAGHKWDGQQRWQGPENEAMRLVNILSPKQFIEKLQAGGISAELAPIVTYDTRLNPATLVLERVEVERSPARICLGRGVVRGVVGLFAWVEGVYTYIDKLQVPCGPEWTLMRFDEYDIPTNERYHGWRTAVLGLIRKGVLTEGEAHRIFGKPVENPASSYYRQQLQELRQERGTIG